MARDVPTGKEILIIGAGVCGLMIARELSRTGHRITILEAAASPGGRIATVHETGFNGPVETGAEFIHGNLPLTIRLLKEANIGFNEVTGEMKSFKKGSPSTDLESFEEKFIKKATTLDRDMTLTAFFDKYFVGNQSKEMRDAITRYAQGFDLADPDLASVYSLRDEWSQEQEGQYRIDGGYLKLIEFLFQECLDHSVSYHSNAFVNEINCTDNSVSVSTREGKKFEAEIVVVTASVGVLQNDLIKFNPSPGQHLNAIRDLGFGSVIKFLLEFKSNFWKDKYPEVGFFISDEKVPTWWTQNGGDSGLLTGWLGGPPALAYNNLTQQALLTVAIESLASIFSIATEKMMSNIASYKISDWSTNPFVKGAYSYSTVQTNTAREILREPINNKLFFAGEALWSGTSQGTVEAALQSGVEVSKQIMSLSK